MKYGKISLCESANGVGLRTCLFVSGCTHHCKGCFNPETWDFDYGKPFTTQEENYIVGTMDTADGLTILGGEPMEVQNQKEIVTLIERVKETGKTVWIYSGYTLEELRGLNRCRGLYTDAILSLIDVLVDGEFVEELKDITLAYRGSRNQRIWRKNAMGNFCTNPDGSYPADLSSVCLIYEEGTV